MKRVVVIAILLCLVSAGVSQAAITQLTSTTRGGYLELNCTYAPSTEPNLFDITYTLTNWAANNPIDNTPTFIRGFTLEFPSGIVDVANPADFVVGSWGDPGNTPALWTVLADPIANSLKWSTAFPAAEIAPNGGVATFGFTAYWEPAVQNVTASGIDGAAYSGFTCGPAPIIPEASSVVLALMGLSSVAGFRKLYRK